MLSQGLEEEPDSARQASRRTFQEEGMAQAEAGRQALESTAHNQGRPRVVSLNPEE